MINQVVKLLTNLHTVAYATLIKNMSTKKQPQDPRVIRTLQLLQSSLIALIPEKGYAAITIQDITDRASLHRATFYLHYRDKQELLIDTFNRLMVLATPLPPKDTVPLSQVGIDSIAMIFHQMAKHADFFRVLLTEESAPAFNNQIRQYITEVSLKWFSVLQPDAEKSIVQPEIAISYLGSAYLGVVAWWLQNRMPYTPEIMATQLMSLTVLGLLKSLNIDSPLSSQSLDNIDK